MSSKARARAIMAEAGYCTPTLLREALEAQIADAMEAALEAGFDIGFESTDLYWNGEFFRDIRGKSKPDARRVYAERKAKALRRAAEAA